MGNLILTRRTGQSVKVGKLTLTVREIRTGKIYVQLGDDFRWLHLGDEFCWLAVLDPGALEACTVTIAAIARGNVRLSFNAPRDIKIMRTELL